MDVALGVIAHGYYMLFLYDYNIIKQRWVMNIPKGRYVKTDRILTIYSKLTQGEPVEKKKLAKSFNVNEKTIQRIWMI